MDNGSYVAQELLFYERPDSIKCKCVPGRVVS